MTVTVRMFARARDLAGTSEVRLDLKPGATVGELRQHLAHAYPRLAPLLERSALAVDNELAPDTKMLSSESEIALLPPVSGG
jgi:molybdopterin synthase catalytic subunit